MAGVVLLVALLAGCGFEGAAAPGDERRRYADYVTPDSADPQCSLPVEERRGGWFCYGEPTTAP